MRILCKFGAGLCLTVALGFGMTYRGQLMDATCVNQTPSPSGEKTWVTCAPTEATTSFAIHTEGKVRMLDAAGNDKARTAYQEGDLKRDRNGDMPIVIDGKRHHDTITVESIRARGSDVSVH